MDTSTGGADTTLCQAVADTSTAVQATLLMCTDTKFKKNHHYWRDCSTAVAAAQPLTQLLVNTDVLKVLQQSVADRTAISGMVVMALAFNALLLWSIAKIKYLAPSPPLP